MSETKRVRTSELRAGDIVHHYGMRILVGEVKVSTGHPSDFNGVRYTLGHVLNLDDLQDEWLKGMIRSDSRSTPERPVWVIQGNDLAYWYVERPVWCDMAEDCPAPVTHIDQNGFVYCTDHGTQRRDWKPCRKLRPHELRRLERGEQVTRY